MPKITTLRQREVLGETEHRPWPLPERPWFMAQTWCHLLFAHWRVDADALGRVVPPQLSIDVLDGSPWIAVTPFRVKGLRLRGFPALPVISSFREVNVRTYVTVDGKPGIYFLSLDASSRVAVTGARRTYRLPYHRSRISFERNRDGFRVRSTRVSSDGPAATLDCRYAPIGDRLPVRSGSLERWLSERYCLYTLDDRGVVQRGEIQHPPWPLWLAAADFRVNTMASPFGIGLEGEPILHFSPRQDVLIWTIAPA